MRYKSAAEQTIVEANYPATRDRKIQTNAPIHAKLSKIPIAITAVGQ
jgi:hypothetical protein